MFSFLNCICSTLLSSTEDIQQVKNVIVFLFNPNLCFDFQIHSIIFVYTIIYLLQKCMKTEIWKMIQKLQKSDESMSYNLSLLHCLTRKGTCRKIRSFKFDSTRHEVLVV